MFRQLTRKTKHIPGSKVAQQNGRAGSIPDAGVLHWPPIGAAQSLSFGGGPDSGPPSKGEKAKRKGRDYVI